MTEVETKTELRGAAARLFTGGTVLCDGAMGSMLYGRGIFINRCYDELNLSQPDLVRAVHTEYLQAGATVIETNTFGGNRIRLERHGLEEKVREINRAGVRLARECVQQMAEKHASEAFVAGAMGPLGIRIGDGNKVTEEEAYAAFAVQVKALVEGGPGVGADLLILETLMAMNEARLAIQAAKAEGQGLPVIAMVTVDVNGNCLDGTSAEEAARLMTEWGADAVGCNCSDGPATVLAVIERMRTATKLPLAAMPNAGNPRVIDGRHIYLTSPEYMASFARKFIKAGATFVGGCCGTTPQHTRAMRGALRAIGAQETGVEVVENGGAAEAGAARAQSKVMPPDLKDRSRVGAKIATGEFVTLVEIVPPKGIDSSKELEGAEELHKLGVDAINVPDSPRASARMSAMSLCVQIQQRVGIETVLHYTCRDRNLLSIQSDLLGASSIGLRNILCLTGDPPKMGTYPDATAVFDVDAIGLTKIVRDMNYGLDIGGHSIGQSCGFTIAVAANPGVVDIDNEVRRFAAKVEAGGEYGITQPVFDLRLLEQFLKRIEQFRIPMIAGIWPLTSVKNAEFMRDQLKVRMPEEILARMGAMPSPEHAKAEGIAIAQEMLEESRAMVQGVQVSAPFGKYKAAAQVLGVL
ncbi:bifunctional homocysteine S-methyltransferase/methylenetetrahydrofolate reductase [Granulicella tundricola]|uniref:Homocysteine S-methyltransferase n=1 Tax=Granulicella tundricola (strain ATCC BAA-1859 / DSM 23138 / MP5ACTX9) TaxID=1198114 RepID=E8WWG5_GRATM|nr:bifunctional homocysteine S-methyltransferase/methylenetetrahydrofolate reductase [Granulicella tundricola]ADW69629.1 homocysteine S-methyltransferase [Granulicella tundricola MP5ACTX9]